MTWTTIRRFEMQRLGLLVKVPVTEPCGDGCNCAEYGDFQQDCLRLAPDVERAMFDLKGT